MIESLSFFGEVDKNPYLHIRDFEQTCDCLRIEGISDKTLRWKLFPFSLKGRARQWYNQKVSKQQGDWGVLRSNLRLDFYTILQIVDLRVKILTFKQKENESLAQSWICFLELLESGPHLNIEGPTLLQHFYKGLHKKDRELLNTTFGGSFLHKPSSKAKLMLDRILDAEMDNILYEETHEAEDNTLPDTPSTSAIPEPQKEEIPPPNFMLDIDPDLFTDFRNISKYFAIPKPRSHSNYIHEIPSKSILRELVSIMSSEWLEESELSSEVICLDSPSIPIRCELNAYKFDALYNPLWGVNIMSKSLVHRLLGKVTLTPTTKLMKSLSGHLVPTLGILHVLHFMVEGAMVHLNFYIFDTWDFDLLRGQPFRRLLYDGQNGKLNISLGKNFQFPLTIFHSLNNKTKSFLLPDPMKEVRYASWEFLRERDLEEDAPFFIEEEAGPSEPKPLDEFAEAPRPPIELNLYHLVLHMLSSIIIQSLL